MSTIPNAEFQKRAMKGGEFGPNGEWYKGGAFIATKDNPKSAPHGRQMLRERGVRHEAAPGDWRNGARPLRSDHRERQTSARRSQMNANAREARRLGLLK